MKKVLKITLIVLGILVSVVALDTIQAKIFDNSPILKIRKDLKDGYVKYVDKGLFVNHYHCSNNEDATTWKWTKFTCPINVEDISLEDINDKIGDFIDGNPKDINNYAYYAIDTEKQVVVVGLVDNTENKQEEFITKVFSNYGSEYISYIKNNNLIEFRESKEIFEAKIITIENDFMTVEALKNSVSFKKGDKVKMKITHPTDGTNDFYVVGNKVKITFNGMVLTSNPPQITAIKIELI